MCEADLSSADQVVIFKGDFACLQAINLTAFTTGDLVFMGGTKFLPVGVSSQQNVVRWNSLIFNKWYNTTVYLLQYHLLKILVVCINYISAFSAYQLCMLRLAATGKYVYYSSCHMKQLCVLENCIKRNIFFTFFTFWQNLETSNVICKN